MMLIVLGVLLLLAYSIFHFFLRHLIHWFFRGCGLVVLVIVVLYMLRVLKLI
jgi:hypothetical protein